MRRDNYIWVEICISCHIKCKGDVANRCILNFIYLAQIKSTALFRIKVNTFSQNTSGFKLISRALNCCRNKSIVRRNTYHPEYYYILHYCRALHIALWMLLHFALLLHFVSVITICGITQLKFFVFDTG